MSRASVTREEKRTRLTGTVVFPTHYRRGRRGMLAGLERIRADRGL